MNNFTLKKIIIHILIILFIFLLDRFSKIYILNIAETAGEVDIYINSILHLILIWNTGIGFGLFSLDQSYAYNLITILIGVVIIYLIYLIIKSQFIDKALFSMVLGGAIGNFYDRLIYFAVPDFIDIHYQNFHWFTFNIADIFISIE